MFRQWLSALCVTGCYLGLIGVGMLADSEQGEFVGGWGVGCRVESDQSHAVRVRDREVLERQRELADVGMPEPFGAVGPLLYVASTPVPVEVVRAGPEFRHERTQDAVVAMARRRHPQLCSRRPGEVAPLDLATPRLRIAEQVPGEVALWLCHRPEIPEQASGQVIPHEHVEAVVDDHRGDVVQLRQQLRQRGSR